MCAVKAAERHTDKRFVIIEKADRVGKKLLVTGNGRCNLTHLDAGAQSYHGEGSEELINILFEKYSTGAVTDYFHRLGLLTHADSEGRVYPLSNQSSSVLDVLRRRAAELEIEEVCSAEVMGIQKSGQGYEIFTPERHFYAQKLIIAAGGRADHAGRESGSRELLRMMGLATVKSTPSLSPIKVKGDLTRSLKGIRTDSSVSLYQDGELIKKERGELQFADGALSGICVFDLSREANKNGGEISVNLLPDFSFEEIYNELKERQAAHTKGSVQPQATDIFVGMFHKNIGLALLKSCGIRPSSLCKDISDKELKKLASTIGDWRFTAEPCRDFKKAQVTAGGVKLSEIDPHTFEVKKHRGLYVIGEALDIDGDCGGYNLQFAFASAMCAGDSL